MTEGLRWLARHQEKDGYWRSDAPADAFAPVHCASGGSERHDVGVTGLALLAFLGAGYTHLTKETYVDPVSAHTVEWGEVIKGALKWLRLAQRADGTFVQPDCELDLFDHAIATFAMVECYGLTNATLFKDSAENALKALLASQNPGKGWREEKDGPENDTMLTAWCVMTFRGARRAGLEVPDAALEGAYSWIVEATDPESGKTGSPAEYAGEFLGSGPRFGWDAHEALTAAGMIVRIDAKGDAADPALAKGAQLLLKDLPRGEGHATDSLYWFLGSSALFQLDGNSEAPTWKPWNEAMLAALVPAQKTKNDGCAAGSWDPGSDRWGKAGGRVATTALDVLTLEVYYWYVSALRHVRK